MPNFETLSLTNRSVAERAIKNGDFAAVSLVFETGSLSIVYQADEPPISISKMQMTGTIVRFTKVLQKTLFSVVAFLRQCLIMKS